MLCVMCYVFHVKNLSNLRTGPQISPKPLPFQHRLKKNDGDKHSDKKNRWKKNKSLLKVSKVPI